jgi:hypothetical protein
MHALSSRALVLAAILASVGCSDVLGIPTVIVPQLGKVGDGQTAIVGQALASPLLVTVVDQDQSPLVGFPVAFDVTMGGGTVASAMVVTDSFGRAQTTFTTGPTPGTNQVVAHLTGLAGSILFSETGILPIIVKSGDGQTAVAGAAAAQPLGVTLLDADQHPLSGYVVTFGVTTYPESGC